MEHWVPKAGVVKVDGRYRKHNGRALGAVVADEAAEDPRARPVLYAQGALYGYCPTCGAPGEWRERPPGDPPGRDRCQRKHVYPSMDALSMAGEPAKQPAKQPAKPTRRKGK